MGLLRRLHASESWNSCINGYICQRLGLLPEMLHETHPKELMVFSVLFVSLSIMIRYDGISLYSFVSCSYVDQDASHIITFKNKVLCSKEHWKLFAIGF